MNRYQYLNGMGEHVHQLDGQPLIGTSRVTGVLSKPLSWWAAGCAVQAFGVPDAKILTKIKRGKATSQEKTDHMAALRASHSLIKGMDTDQYAKLIDTAYRAHDASLREKAKGGTDLHSEVERYIKEQMGIEQQGRLFTQYDPQIKPFIEWAEQNVAKFLWSEGHTYSEKLWTGGISDIGCEMLNGKISIVDIKSSREAYPSHFIQIGGYHLQIEESGIVDSEGNHVLTLPKPIEEYYVFCFGGTPQAYPYYDIAGARKAFINALELYKFLPQE